MRCERRLKKSDSILTNYYNLKVIKILLHTFQVSLMYLEMYS